MRYGNMYHWSKLGQVIMPIFFVRHTRIWIIPDIILLSDGGGYLYDVSNIAMH